MNKYIIPTILTLICLIYLTILITTVVIKNEHKKELNTCKGMNHTYKEVMWETEQEINELRHKLGTCENNITE